MEDIDQAFVAKFQKKMNPKFLEAGFLEPDDQGRIQKYKLEVYILGIVLGAGIAYYLNHSPLSLAVGAVVGLYFSLVACVVTSRS